MTWSPLPLKRPRPGPDLAVCHLGDVDVGHVGALGLGDVELGDGGDPDDAELLPLLPGLRVDDVDFAGAGTVDPDSRLAASGVASELPLPRSCGHHHYRWHVLDLLTGLGGELIAAAVDLHEGEHLVAERPAGQPVDRDPVQPALQPTGGDDLFHGGSQIGLQPLGAVLAVHRRVAECGDRIVGRRLTGVDPAGLPAAWARRQNLGRGRLVGPALIGEALVGVKLEVGLGLRRGVELPAGRGGGGLRFAAAA